MADAVILRASVRGAARSARSLDAGKREIQRGLREELVALARRSEAAYRRWAPRDTDEMADSIEARFRNRVVRPSFDIRVSAVRDGFDYLPVTRHGHVQDFIHVSPGRKSENGKRPPAMSVHVSGRDHPPIYRSVVTGALPVYDWVEQAGYEIDREADIAESRLGRRVERSFR